MATTELYDAKIKALARDAAGHGRLQAPSATATRDNPLCGDRVVLDLQVQRDTESLRIAALGHVVRGCLLCQASAAMLGLRAPGLEVASLAELRNAIGEMLAHRHRPLPAWPELDVFAPVAAHRSRHACVTLAIDAALAAALALER